NFVVRSAAPTAPASMAVAPAAGPSALITNQNLSLAASRVEQETRIRSGGPFRQMARAASRSLARYGGQPEIVSTTRTSLAPQAQQLGSGQTTIPTTSAAVVGAPPALMPASVPAPPPPPEVERPTPQEVGHPIHRLF